MYMYVWYVHMLHEQSYYVVHYIYIKGKEEGKKEERNKHRQ